MDDRGGRVAVTPRLAWLFPTVFLCLLLPARAAVAADLGNGAAGVVATVVLFALPLLYAVPPGRALWDRHPRLLLAAQTILTYLPFVLFGQKWAVGLSGLLGGLLLLTIAGRASWILLAVVVAVEGVLRIGVLGIYPLGDAQYISWVFAVPIDIALPLFGLVRLSDLVADLRAARTELVGLAVTQERLWATARLRAAFGGRLETITARARAARAVLSQGPDQARQYLAETAGIARYAVEQVRQTIADEHRDQTPSRAWHAGHTGAAGQPADTAAPRYSGNTVAPRLALLVLIVVLGAFAGHHLVIVADTFPSVPATAVGWAAIVVIVALQLYHSMAGRAGARPRGWQVTLTAQVLLPWLVIGATADEDGVSLIGMVGFSAGSVLLLLAGWRAWLGFIALTASVGIYWLVLVPGDYASVVYLLGLLASTGLAVYGLSRLTDVAEELEAARRELARAAVERERLRLAQDTHDLLGLGLSAIALKCDLAGRLIGRDDARARQEVDALIQLAAQARTDIQAVTTGEHDLSLAAELAATREVLASAGVAVQIHADPPAQPLPEQTSTALATMLREAVTNVVRHTNATRCHIELTTDDNATMLRVTNDGVTDEAPHPAPARNPRTGGRGLANLAARAEALGGRLSTHVDGDDFELAVQIPRPADLSPRPAVKDPFTASDPAHRIDEVGSRTVLDEEP